MTEQPTLHELCTRVKGRLIEMHTGTISFIRQLMDENRQLRLEIDRLKEEIRKSSLSK